MMEVNLSPVQYEDDEDDRDEILDEIHNEVHSGSEGHIWREPTKIYMTPLFVPLYSHNRNDVTFNSNAADNNQLPDLTRSSGSETSGGSTQRLHAYDTEESCLIVDLGVESDYGKVHYPSSWNQDVTDAAAAFNDLYGSSDEGDVGVSRPLVNSHDIMVVRPFAKEFPCSKTSPDDEILFFLPKPKSLDSKPASREASVLLRTLERESDISRAKQLLAMHDNFDVSPTGATKQTNDSRRSPNRVAKTQPANFSPPRLTDEKCQSKNEAEDGTAALGGNWPSLSTSGSIVKLTQETMREPELHLRDIHEAGTRYLRVSTSPSCSYKFLPF
jgi:hypothetical protein